MGQQKFELVGKGAKGGKRKGKNPVRDAICERNDTYSKEGILATNFLSASEVYYLAPIAQRPSPC